LRAEAGHLDGVKEKGVEIRALHLPSGRYHHLQRPAIREGQICYRNKLSICTTEALGVCVCFLSKVCFESCKGGKIDFGITKEYGAMFLHRVLK
jgi:hypothetical protein